MDAWMVSDDPLITLSTRVTVLSQPSAVCRLVVNVPAWLYVLPAKANDSPSMMVREIVSL